ncbi:LysE/ArgO family amino acid transporter [Corynebacterium spheniscorum]|uniref:L-lysine exporter family protein LysE/ArgO n=1 Tax=Corynebacterium spheniscorum TaxID=185761 RepID=A0A1I2SKZ3_9CORY|nr:LysE family transporter [Corynebacterium spheniscorum]KAA8723969.1 amino acid transporter [Corynebacterium spheniscorum]SFG50916.1 L-lysine exporter family protein LysE/ArgO [Corynebacterium spheniscorum]
MSTSFPIVLAGLALGFSLILAIGPQNLLVLKTGIRKTGITAVIITCVISEILLCTAGALGVGGIIAHLPQVMNAIRYAGVAYLLWFAFLSARDAIYPKVAVQDIENSAPTSAPTAASTNSAPTTQNTTHTTSTEPLHSGSAVLTKERVRAQKTWVKPVTAALLMTWLNPGAYVDALVIIGGIANQYVGPERWYFIGGCILASLIWFPALGYGARALATPLSSPQVWRGINAGVALVLTTLALKLLTM